jgi:dTDP-4-dehydrorhamnose reductase
VPHVAAAIVALLEDGTPGTYHATNACGTCWHEFATELFHQARLTTVVTAITSGEYPSPVARPPYSILDTAKLARLGITLPDWRQGIADNLAAQWRTLTWRRPGSVRAPGHQPAIPPAEAA